MSDSTRSFYLRTLRLMLNRAMEEGLSASSGDLFMGLDINATFDRSHGNCTGLDRETLRRISEVRFPDSPETETVRDMFMFGFYCRGMELIDVLNLAGSDVHGDMLVYRRRTKGHSHTVVLDKGTREIIEKYRSSGNVHIFPIKDKYKGRQQYSVSDIVRRHIKRIGNVVGVSRPHVRDEHKRMAATCLRGKRFRYAVVWEHATVRYNILIGTQSGWVMMPSHFEYMTVQGPRCFANAMPNSQKKKCEVTRYSDIGCSP